MVKLFARKVTPRLERLRRIPLFAKLSPRELRIVDGLVHQREYPAEEVIFDEGEEGQAIYIVIEGEVFIGRQGMGEAGCIAIIGPGGYFGDMALLDNMPRTAQARATKATSLAVYFREDFLALMETHARIASKIALQLARTMGQRLRNAALDPNAAHRHL